MTWKNDPPEDGMLCTCEDRDGDFETGYWHSGYLWQNADGTGMRILAQREILHYLPIPPPSELEESIEETIERRAKEQFCEPEPRVTQEDIDALKQIGQEAEAARAENSEQRKRLGLDELVCEMCGGKGYLESMSEKSQYRREGAMDAAVMCDLINERTPCPACTPSADDEPRVRDLGGHPWSWHLRYGRSPNRVECLVIAGVLDALTEDVERKERRIRKLEEKDTDSHTCDECVGCVGEYDTCSPPPEGCGKYICREET